MSDVVVTDQAFGNVDRERAMAQRLGVSFSDHQCTTEDETADAVVGARVAFVNFAPMTERVLASMRPGATVVRYGIGYDNVDVAAAHAFGVSVCNVPDYGADTVADHAASALLALLRKLPMYDRAIRREGWVRPPDLGTIRAFSNTIVGLIGTGRIGRAVATRLKAFGFQVWAHDPFVHPDDLARLGINPVSLDRLLREADAISLHAPLTAQNYHVIGEREIDTMKRGAVIVNTSRGPLIDTAALIAALTQQKLGGAALDVFETEPVEEDSALRQLDSVILTPHAAFYSDQSLDNLQRLAAEEGERALRGKSLRCEVN
ncbi:C-terminal binding protein [Microbacterium sp. MPKO10]|uniref:C-terminal binding protein n=1 Tax=Microbacterium sp. MPKO10 TaxID=2989818 RepID=UPI00223654E4|nr:C-terminal binding protein [Microbacterium sp. MPKO10]MCW4458656.1 C-terminal binding protein [Microbacterium sp. MPKO10]